MIKIRPPNHTSEDNGLIKPGAIKDRDRANKKRQGQELMHEDKTIIDPKKVTPKTTTTG